MTLSEAIRGCRDASGLSEVLSLLGYDVVLQPLPLDSWVRRGVQITPIPDVRLFRASHFGAIDLIVGEGTADRGSLEKLMNELNLWNSVVQFIILYIETHTMRISIFGLDPARRVRRLDIDPEAPRAESLSRLELMERRPGMGMADLMARLARTFEKESVGRRFFLGFRAGVESLTRELQRLHPEEDGRETSDEALLILSRVLFLSFIQQKGWLDGNRFFLRDLTRVHLSRKEGLFSGLLLPLFFGCLNTPMSMRDRFARRLGRIPYLNGGLFEPSRFEKRHPAIRIDDGLLEEMILDRFDRYQFTVEEDDEAGAHIDPEMLGRVFESLMADDERLASGSFYTPRTVVDILTSQSLDSWLAAGDRKLEASLSSWRCGDPAGLSKLDRRALLARLRTVRILDPACGSGAFLLAAMQAVERLRNALADRPGQPCELRRRIAAKALFGVDLKPEAVRLCELRIWLSIVSAWHGDPLEIDPLPNLDRNILQGNSLLGPIDLFAASGPELFREWALELRARSRTLDRYRGCAPAEKSAICSELRKSDIDLAGRLLASHARRLEERSRAIEQKQLFRSGALHQSAEAGALRDRIDEALQQKERIERGELGFFAADLHFAHVLESGGFDIVLGNPPWVRSARIEPTLRRALAERYRTFGRGAAGRGIPQADLSIAFFERSLQLTAKGGVVGMLVPVKFATAGYASSFRRQLVHTTRVVALHDWSDESRELFEADTFPFGVVVEKGGSPGGIRIVDGGEPFAMPQRRLGSDGGPWMLVRRAPAELLDRIRRRFPRFESVVGRPAMGVRTGANAAFFVDDVRLIGHPKAANVDGLMMPLDAVVRSTRGRDVQRWNAGDSVWMLWPEKRREWVEQWEDWRGLQPGSFRIARPAGFDRCKVVWKDVSRRMTAAVLPPSRIIEGESVPLVPNQTTYTVAVGDEQLAWGVAALLNSTIAGALLVAAADRAKDRHFRYFGRTVAALPSPGSTDELRKFAALARTCSHRPESEENLDREIARLYAVSPPELEILAEFLAERAG
ncbi:MAG: Eco57I restriction-modification methylase domain-containing protein [Thermoanaerobaculia bacterium]